MSGAQPTAVIAGAICVVAEINPDKRKRHEQGWVDELFTDLSAITQRLETARQRKAPSHTLKTASTFGSTLLSMTSMSIWGAIRPASICLMPVVIIQRDIRTLQIDSCEKTQKSLSPGPSVICDISMPSTKCANAA